MPREIVHFEDLLEGYSTESRRHIKPPLTIYFSSCVFLAFQSTQHFEHITPTLVALHWLPFKFRCQYKLLLYAFKALHGLAPSYLGELIHFYKLARSLRSQSAALIEMPKKRTN
jgi:hypothetical protein